MTPARAFQADLEQWIGRAHGLTQRWEKEHPVRAFGRKVAGQSGETAVAAGETAAAEAVGRAVEAGLSLSGGLPGAVVGLGLHLAIRGGRAVVQRARPTESDEGVDSAVARHITTLTYFAREVMPVIVAVEDLHRADADTAQLVRGLLEASSGAVLLITTTWPGYVNGSAPGSLGDLLAVRPPDRHLCLHGDTDVPLELSARRELAAHLVPDARPDVHEALAAKYELPWAMEVVASSRRFRRALASGDPASALSSLPSELLNLYRSLWQDLPAPERAWCELGALISVGETNDGRGEADLFDAEALRLATDDNDVSTIVDDHNEGPELRSWLAEVPPWAQRFLQAEQRTVASEEARANYDVPGGELDRFFLAFAAAVEMLDPSDPRERHHATVVVALHDEGLIPTGSNWLRAVVLLSTKDRPSRDVVRRCKQTVEWYETASRVSSATWVRTDGAISDREMLARLQCCVIESHHLLGNANEARRLLDSLDIGDLAHSSDHLARLRPVLLQAASPEQAQILIDAMLWDGGPLDQRPAQERYNIYRLMCSQEERVLGRSRPETVAAVLASAVDAYGIAFYLDPALNQYLTESEVELGPHIAALESTIEKDPGGRLTPALAVRAAQLLYQKGEYERADGLYGSYRAAANDVPVGDYVLELADLAKADAELNRGRHDEGVRLLIEVGSGDPDPPAQHRAHARLLALQHGARAKAEVRFDWVDTLNRVWDHFLDEGAAHVPAQLVLAGAGQYEDVRALDEAETLLTRYLSALPFGDPRRRVVVARREEIRRRVREHARATRRKPTDGASRGAGRGTPIAPKARKPRRRKKK
jgi:tetratricopeptide (TPR) repeat protein